MRPGRVVAPINVNRGSSSRMLLRRRSLAEDDVEVEVLERRIQDLLDGPRHAMDLVDEQHVAVLEVGEDRGQVARTVERGTGGRLEPGPHLVRDDLAERGLAQPGRPAEEQVVDGFAPLARPVDQERELLLDPLLSDELLERSRPERDVELGVVRAARPPR